MRNMVGKHITTTLVLLAVAAIALGVFLALDLTAGASSRQSPEKPAEQSSSNASTPSRGLLEAFPGLGARAVVTIGLLALCLGMMLRLTITRVLRPLDIVAQTANEISRGNLSVSAQTAADGSVGKLSHTLNDIAANYQEFILVTGARVGASLEAVDRIQAKVDQASAAGSDPDLRDEIHILRYNLDLLSELVREFRFFQAHFDGRKVVRTARSKDR
ncbi:MAG: HAMP domain-containing protein [Deltaproteobacteria bacterium]|nr:HAMP domain-containing protein [Deltaproteobacteria bacterium]